MASIDDLKAAVAAESTAIAQLATDVASETADVDAALAVITNPNSTDADVEAAATAITNATTNIKSASQALQDSAAKIKAAVPSAP